MKFAPGKRDSITDRPYFFVSECGEFYVALPLRDSEPYLTFRKPDPASRLPATCLGGYPTAKLAKAAAEAAT